MLKKLILVVGTALLLVTSAAAQPQPAAALTEEQLFGVWQIVSFQVETGGTTTTPYGANPAGHVAFVEPDRFLVFLVDPDRPAPAAAAVTDTEAATLFRRMTAWAATFEIDPTVTPDGNLVTVSVYASANQLLTGSQRAYYFRIEGDRLIGMSVPQAFAQTGQTSVTRMIYERVQ